jgi:hypothetical protein
VTRNNEDRRFVKDRRKISCSLKTAIIIKIRRKCEYCVALCRSNFTNFILQILRILQHIFLFRIGYLQSRLTSFIQFWKFFEVNIGYKKELKKCRKLETLNWRKQKMFAYGNISCTNALLQWMGRQKVSI